MSGLAPMSAITTENSDGSLESIIRVIYRDGAGTLHMDWPVSRIEECLRDTGGILWVDIHGPEEHSNNRVERWLCEVFHFHALAVEDALKERHIPKVDDWGDYLYVVFHLASIEPKSDVLKLHELDIFLGLNYLVTYHTAPFAILEQDRQIIQRDPRDRLRHGADHLLIRFLELAIDQSLTAIEHLDDRVDAIQEAVIENASSKNLQSIFKIKRSAIELH
jgi:magnesium transporter